MSGGTCAGCGAPILWAVTLNAKRMPLNPDPDELGNVAAYLDDQRTLRCRVLGPTQQPAPHEKRYMPHWATCTSPPPKRRKPATSPALKTHH